MTYSKFTNRTITTPYQDAGRGGSAVTTIVLHHMASTSLDGVLSMWVNATRDGSANYAIGNEGQVVGAVPEENRSWSLANYAFDAHSITFEIENESTDGWTISAAASEATARVVADLCARYGIPCDRAHIMGHREVYQRYGVSYATACPGGLNIDWIVARANQIRPTIAALGGETTTIGDEFDMASLDDLRTIVNAAAADIKASVRREERGRLYYCATPPAGLPHFVCIFWGRPVGQDNILYANDDHDGGVQQATNWGEKYYQTADTVTQAMKAAVEPGQYQKLVDFALGKDSSFTDAPS